MLCEAEKQRFARAFAAGSLPHACIVECRTEETREDFVFYCVRLALCEGERPPCGSCLPCRKLRLGSHPDLRYIGGTDGKSATIAEVRALIADSRQYPTENGRKIYVIRNAEKLRRESQNALLKVLEEPPEKVVIFLLAARKEALLPTVRSRCRLIQLTDEPKADNIDKAAFEMRERADKAVSLLLSGNRKFDFFTFMCSSPRDKAAREKEIALLGCMAEITLEILKAKDGHGDLRYTDLAAVTGRRSLCGIANTLIAARYAAEGNANLTSLNAALAVKLWELRT